MQRGQTTLEFLMILGVALLILLVTITISNDQGSALSTRKSELQASLAATDIGNAAREVYAQGMGARKLATVTLPRSYNGSMSYINSTALVIRAGRSDYVQTFPFQVKGALPARPGTFQFLVENEGGVINVGRWLAYANASAIGGSINGGESYYESIDLSSISSSASNVTVQCVWENGSVNILCPSLQAVLAPNSDTQFQVGFEADPAAYGTFSGYLNITVEGNGGNQTIEIPVSIYVNDLSNPLSNRIVFLSPTPANGASQSLALLGVQPIVVNASIRNVNLGELRFRLGTTDYRQYDDSLVAMYNFDENPALGEGAGTVADASKYGNNASMYDSVRLLMHMDEADGNTSFDGSAYHNDGVIYGNTRLLLHMDENTGGTAFDESAYKNNGTCVGMASVNGANACSWVAGKNGAGIDLSGASDYIQLPVIFSGDQDPMTFTAWVRLSNVSSSGSLFGEYDSTGQTRNYIVVAAGTLQFDQYQPSGGAANSGVSMFNEGNWNHIAVVKSNDLVSFYKDGAFVTSVSHTETYSGAAPTVAAIGSRYINGGWSQYNLNATIDEVGIYSKALSASEISAMYNATRAKHADWVAGRSGTGLEFDGVDDYVPVAASPSLNLNGSVSLSAWIKASPGSSSNYRMIISKEESASVDPYRMYLQTGSSVLVFNSICGGAMGTSALNDNAWHHVVGTRDDSAKVASIYIDGVLHAQSEYPSSCSNPQAASDTPTWIGKAIYMSRFPFNGTIDEAAVYDRVLNPSEIFDQFSQGRATHPESVEGVYGKALKFDGVDDYARFSLQQPLGTGDYSISIWFKKPVGGSQLYLISPTSDASVGNYTFPHIRAGNNFVWLQRHAMSAIYLYYTSDTNWHQVVFTRRLGRVYGYLDGVDKSIPQGDVFSNQSGLDFTGTSFYAGRFFYGGANYHNSGSIDELRVWKRALSAAEVLQQYKSNLAKVAPGQWLFTSTQPRLDSKRYDYALFARDLNGQYDRASRNLFVTYNTIGFVPSTPNSGSSASSASLLYDPFVVNTSIANASLSALNFGWDGANYSYYDSDMLVSLGFDNAASLGENATNFVDSSANGFNGSCAGATCPSTVEGKYGKALYFDGFEDYLSVPNNDVLNSTTSQFSLSYWVKPSVLSDAGLVTKHGQINDVQVLIVAGGGGGANSDTSGGGGGGAGGLLQGVLPGLSGSYAVVVGLGGLHASGRGASGGDSLFGDYVAYGGGGGGYYGNSGGSGGSSGGYANGGGYSGAVMQTSQYPLTGYGNSGVYLGGGGATGNGTTYNNGPGLYSTITGTNTYYAGGGGWNGAESVYYGQGGAPKGSGYRTGSDGKQGIVVIRYPASYGNATGGTVTTVVDGGVAYRVHTFTSSGTFSTNGTSGWATDLEPSGKVSFKLGLNTTGYASIESATALSQDDWYFITSTWNGTHMSVYVNGVLESTQPAAGVLNGTSDVVIGRDASSTADYFDGSIDEVRVWDRALSSSEVAQHYISSLNKYAPDKWMFLYNRTLAAGAYSYEGYARDAVGWNSTGARSFSSVYNRIGFIAPTPAGGLSVNLTEASSVGMAINASLSGTNLSQLTLELNGTNYTAYDSSLVLAYNFDNNSAVGDSDERVTDLSRYGNTGAVSSNLLTLHFDDNDGFIAQDSGPYRLNGTVYGDTLLLLRMNESTGSFVYDDSRYSTNGTCYSAGVIANCSRVAGKSGNGLQFDGADDYVWFGNSVSFRPPSSISVESWFKAGVLSVNSMIYRYGSYGEALYLDSFGSPCFYIFNASATAFTACSPIRFNDSTWHHAIGTYNGSMVFIYVDGVLQNSSPAGTIYYDTTGSSGVAIGRSGPFAVNYFNGSIDEVAIYNRSLSASEAAEHYAAGKAKFAEWDADGKSGTAMRFDGINDYVDLGTDSRLNQSNNIFSISAWVKTGDSENWQWIYQFGQHSDHKDRSLVINAGSKATLYTYSGDAVGTTTVTDNEWHHLVGTSDGTTTRIYVDGVLEKSATPTFSSFTYSGARIGINNPGGYYPFNGSIDEVAVYNTALSATDVSQMYNEGKPKHLNYVNGRFGKAVQFDGAYDYVSVGDYSTLEPNTLSISAWVNPAYPTAHYQMIVDKQLSTGAYGYTFRLEDTTGKLFLRTYGTSSSDLMGSTSLSANTWHFVTATYDGVNSKIYVNGVLDASKANTGSISYDNSILKIGRRTDGYYFNGSIDEVRIWNRSLSADEVRMQYYSNLNKYSQDKWLFSTTSFANSIGGYSFNAYLRDADGAWNSTGARTVTVTNSTSISFLSPTPAEGSSVYSGAYPVAAAVANQPNISSFYLFAGKAAYPVYDDSLVLMYNFDNVASIGESAAKAVDVSRYGNNGTVYGNANWTTNGKYGGAMVFDGVNDYVEAPLSASIGNISNDFTMSAWFKRSGPSGGTNDAAYHGILRGGRNWAPRILVASDGSNVLLEECLNGSGAWHSLWTSAVPFNVGEWHQVLVRKGAYGTEMYIDGRLSAYNRSMYGTTTVPTTSFLVGCGATPLLHYMANGLIDEVRVWNRSLSAAEIQQQYYSSLNKFAPDKWFFQANVSGVHPGVEDLRVLVRDASNNTFVDRRSVNAVSSQAQFFGPTPSGKRLTSSIAAMPFYPIAINASVTNISLSNLSFQWGASNYSLYDGSLVLAYNFDNAEGIGDSARQVTDLSRYGNNGSIYGNTALLLHMDEAAGNVTYDEGAYRNNGTCYNMGGVAGASACNWVSGKSDSGITFDGQNDYIEIAQSASLNQTNQGSVELWFKTSQSSGLAILANKYAGGSPSTNVGWELYLYNGKISFAGRDGSGSYVSSGASASTCADGVWHHAVGVLSGSIWSIYLDGVKASFFDTGYGSTNVANTRTILIGQEISTYYFNGTIDEVGIFNRSLSAAEVLDHYYAGKAKHADYTADGKYGGALMFDGVDDFVNVTSSTAMDFAAASNYTYSAWFRTADGSSRRTIIADVDAGVTKWTEVGVRRYYADYEFYVQSGSRTATYVNPNYFDNAWHQVVGVVGDSGTSVSIYLDGALVNKSSGLTPADCSTGNLSIGSYGKYLSGGMPIRVWNGSIDEVRVWNRSLTADEIRVQYYSNLAKYAPDKWLFSYSVPTDLAPANYDYAVFANDYLADASWGAYSGRKRITATQDRIAFIGQTPATSSTFSAGAAAFDPVQINASIGNLSLSSAKLNWNGANSTLFDSSLVLMYNFDGVASIGDNSTVAVDVSSYSNNGTIYGAAWADGKYGKSLLFNGLGDYVSVGTLDGLNYSYQGTVSAWFNALNFDYQNQSIVDLDRRYLEDFQESASDFTLQRVGIPCISYAVSSEGPNQFANFTVYNDGYSVNYRYYHALSKLAAGQNYSLSFDYKTSYSGIGSVNLYYDYYNLDPNGVTPTLLTDGLWHTYTIYTTVPAGYSTTYYGFSLRNGGQVNGSYLYLDNLKLTPAKSGIYVSPDNKLVFSLGNRTVYANAALDSAWHQATATYNANDTSLYVDGVLVGSNTTWFSNASMDVKIGGSRSDSYFDGSIDEVRVWNRSLSPDEVYAQYSSNLAKYAPNRWMLSANRSVSAVGGYSFYGYANESLAGSFTPARTVQATNNRIGFVLPTPADGAAVAAGAAFANGIAFNASIVNANLSSFKFNWNGTNTSYYDDSLVLAYNFDDALAAGDTNERVIDYSRYGNNGAVSGNVLTLHFDEENGSFALDSSASRNNGVIYGDTAGLWHFDEGDGNTTYDDTRFASNGTVYGNTRLLLHMDEGAGNKTYDESAYKNNGTCYNMLGGSGITNCNWSSGKSGMGMGFDGVNDYVLVNASDSLNPTSALSAEAWVYPTNVSGAHRIFSKTESGGYTLLITNGALYLSVMIGGSYYVAYCPAISANQWHHVVGTYNGANLACYLDSVSGTPVVRSGSITSSAQVLAIGAEPNDIPFSSTTDLFEGTIDEFAIYSSAFGASEVLDHYNAGKAKHADWVAGKSGTALAFDGVDDYVYLNRSLAQMASKSTVTIEAWLKPTGAPSTGTGDYAVWRIDAAVGETAGQCPVIARGIIGGQDRIWAGNWDYSNPADWVGVTYNVDEWVHIAIVHSGGMLYIYKDGVLGGSVASGDSNVDTGSYQIGRSEGGQATFFNGSVDEVAIYNRSLSASEVAEHYAAGRASHLERVAGRKGNGLQFDGVNDYLAGSANGINGTKRWATTGWFRTTGTGEILVLDTRAGIRTGICFLQAANDFWRLILASPSAAIKDYNYVFNLNDGNWHHYAITRDGDNSLSLYVDGAYATPTMQTNADMTSIRETWSTFTLGAFNQHNYYFWNGSIDEVAVYNSSLSAAEVLQMYEDGVPKHLDYVDGKYGKAVQFDGVRDFVSVPNSAGLNPAGSLSLEAWVKPDALGGRQTIFSKDYSANTDPYYQYHLEVRPTGELYFAVAVAGTRYYIDCTGFSVTPGRWHHVVATYDGGALRLYRDSVVYSNQTAASGAISQYATDLQIGRIFVGGSDIAYFNGSIDEARVWNRSLTASEIQQHYYSNLAKYSADRWLFSSTQPISSAGNYTYFAYLRDLAGSGNITEKRTLSVELGNPVSFAPPTPADGAIVAGDTMPIRAVVSNVSQLDQFRLFSNNVAYPYYDDSLVLMYNFDNVASLGENATRAVDVSKYGNNGTIIGSSWTAGKYGGAMSFDGINDFVNATRVEPSSALTLGVWIKADSSCPDYAGILTKWDDASTKGYALVVDPDGTLSFYIFDGYRVPVFSNSSIKTGQWAYATATWDGSKIAIYINGVKENEKSGFTSIAYAVNNLLIGKDGRAGMDARIFKGSLDEVRIWNRSLSADEIKQQYYSNFAKYAPDKWLFQSNQTGLTTGAMNYWAVARDLQGNLYVDKRVANVQYNAISFTSPTSQKRFYTGIGAGTAEPFAITASINASLSSAVLSLNGTNHSFYNESLVLAYNFDDVSSIGDSAGKVVDVSKYGNNGTVYGNTALLLHMDENNGNTTFDEGVYKNNGTCYSAGTVANCNWVAGKSGAGIQFDGVDDYVNVEYGASLNTTDSMTAAVWFKHTAAMTAYNNLVNKGYWSIQFKSGQDSQVGFEISNGVWNRVSGPSNTNDGNWHYVVGTYDKAGGVNNFKIYFDGVLYNQSTVTGPITSSSWPVMVGAYSPSHTYYFNGTIDEVMIANRSISADEVLSRYNAGRAKHANWEPNGKWNSAMKFDGVDDYVDAGNSSVLNTVNAISIGAWVKPNSFSTYQKIANKWWDNTSRGYEFFADGSGVLYFNIATASENSDHFVNSPSNALARDQWQYVAATYDGAKMRVYVNGVVVGEKSQTGSIRQNVASFGVGADLRTPRISFFNGSIDEVRVWNRSLSYDEVKQQYYGSLNKYAPGKWLFTSVQDGPSTTAGSYNYSLYATDSGGVTSFSGARAAFVSHNHIGFVQPSPADAGTVNYASAVASPITINASIAGIATPSEMAFNWNGTSATYMNDSLVLAMNFDDVAAIGDSAAKVVDTSKYGNNGTVYGNTIALLHMDENSGTTAFDESRFANNGACMNMGGGTGATTCNWVSGVNGSGIRFDGGDDYINLGNNPSLKPNGSVTFSAWAKYASIGGGGDNYVLSSGAQTSSTGVVIMFHTGGQLYVAARTPVKGVSTSYFNANLAPNQWYNIVGVYDDAAGTLKTYSNGVLLSMLNASNSSLTNAYPNLTIGAPNNGVGSSTYAFNGTIDEVAIFNRTLSDADVLARYNAGKAKHADWDPDGKWNSAMRFDGKDDFISAGNPASLQFQREITITAWVKHADSQRGYIIDKYGSSNHGPMFSIESNGGLNFYSYNSTVGHAFGGPSTNLSVPVNEWHFVAVSANVTGGYYDFYADGNTQRLTSYTDVLWGTSGNLFIGVRNKASDTSYFNGSIDEVRIWKRSLSADEIKLHYYSSLNKYAPDRWLFQSLPPANATGSYSYYASVRDEAGVSNTTETRTFSIGVQNWISFISPTPADGSNARYGNITVNASIANVSLSKMVFTWNGTNYTYLDNSLVLAMSFDDASAAGDTAGRATDYSNYGNNGTINGNTLLLLHMDEADNRTAYDESRFANNGMVYGNTRLLLHMDEGSGSTAYDEGAYRNNGTIYGATWVVGKSGSGLSFDGNDYVDLGTPSSLNITSAVTISAWVKPQPVQASNWAGIAGKERVGNDPEWILMKDYTSNKWVMWLKTTTSNYMAYDDVLLTSYSGNAWVHFVGTYDGETVILYKNGLEVGRNAAASGLMNSYQNTSFMIGRGGGYSFNGSIDEVGVYSKALSAAEILDHYNAGKAKHTDWVAGKSGTGLQFDGVDDYVKLPSSASLSTPKFTLELWWNASSVGSWGGPFSNRIANANGFQFVNQLSSLTQFQPHLVIWNGASETGNYYAQVTYNLPFLGFKHFVWTYDGGAPRFYADGMEYAVTSTSVSNYPESSQVMIGRSYSAVGGKIDEVAVFNRSFSPSEVLAQYNAGKAKHADWEPNGKWGSAMRFDGVDDYVAVNDSDVLDFTNAVTVSTWVRPNAWTDWAQLVDKDGNFLLRKSGGDALLQWVWYNGTVVRRCLSSLPPVGVWTNVVVTAAGNDVNAIYFNGVSQGCTPSTWFAGGRTMVYNLSIGGNNLGFNGSIDEVRVWNRALSVAEIQQQYYSNLQKVAPDRWIFTSNQSFGPTGGTQLSYSIWVRDANTWNTDQTGRIVTRE